MALNGQTTSDPVDSPVIMGVDPGERCSACRCAQCLNDRAQQRDWMQKAALALIAIGAHQKADSLQLSPLTRALIEEQRSKQRLALAITDYLAGKVNREALAWILTNEMGAQS